MAATWWVDGPLFLVILCADNTSPALTAPFSMLRTLVSRLPRVVFVVTGPPSVYNQDLVMAVAYTTSVLLVLGQVVGVSDHLWSDLCGSREARGTDGIIVVTDIILFQDVFQEISGTDGGSRLPRSKRRLPRVRR